MKSLTVTAGQALKSPGVRRALQFVALVVVLLFFARAVYVLIPDLLSYHWQFDPAYLALAIVVLLVRGPIPAYGWRAILARLGYRIGLWRSIRLVYYSSIAGFVPGSMWHAVSRMYLAERDGVPKLVTAVSVGVETIVVVLAAAVVASLSLLAWHDVPPVLAAGGIVLLAVLIFMMAKPQLLFRVLNWGLGRINRPPLEVRLTAGDMLHVFWPYAVNWLLFGVMCFALVGALYPSISWTSLPVVAGLFSAAWLGGYLAVFVPQGLVVREFFITGLLVSLVGVPVPVAAAVAVLSRAWSMLGIVTWAGLSSLR